MTEANAPTDLRTAYAVDPIGIGARTPTLRWRLSTDRRGASQTAVRVVVASTPERLARDEGDVWDTGKRDTQRPAVRYGGPELRACEAYHWKVKVWDDRGVESGWSESARWEMGPLAAEDWQASWIRRPAEELERGQFSHVRTDVALDGEIERARAYVSASHQYALSINGETVDRGQSFCYPDAQYYETVAVGDDLIDGANAIGVVHNWNGAGQGRPAAKPGLLLQLAVEFADGRERVVTTDGDWRARRAPWRDDGVRNQEAADPIEVIDGRQIPIGWDRPGFDDGRWDAVAVLGEHPVEPWTRLVAQNSDVVRERVRPDSITRVDDDTYVVDFGKVYAGVPVVEFESGSAGHRVDVLAGYRLDDDGTVDDTTARQWTDMRFGYVQPEGASTFRPFNYLGFRYIQIDDPGERLDADRVRLVARHAEMPDTRSAQFECDEPRITDVFELARHSALYGSQEQFVDTPTREKAQFLADAFNISIVTSRAFAERRLTRQAVREFVESHYRYWAPDGRLNAVYPNGDGKRDIPDFTVTFPEWLARFYAVSDDRRTLELAYPVVRAVADYVIDHVDDETGLVTHLSGGGREPYEEGIVDWPPEMRYGYDRDWPALTTVNALCANALDRAAAFASELDRPAVERAYFEDHRDAIEASINERLLDGARYVDGCDASDASDHASQHANALPLATGIVADEVADEVAERVASAGLRMGPMTAPWLLEALDAADRPGALVELLTDAESDGWANVVEQGGTFTWESWHCRDPDLSETDRRNRSESHAMGATVLAYILRTLLGVDVAAPGGAAIEIAPPRGGLDAASGRVPSERGPVAVSWTRGDGEFSLDVTVPWNTEASVVLPAASPTRARVTEDGDELFEDGEAVGSLPDGIEGVETRPDGIDVEITAGEYAFELDH